MSNLAHKIQRQHEERRQQLPKTKTLVKKRSKITFGEKMLGCMFIGLVTFGSFNIVTNHVEIYHINSEIQSLEGSMEAQLKKNRELELRVAEESSYEVILEKAKKLGLTLNENNVKNVGN
ncbi:cell division protein FtsL [Sutcliffiella rhizosphaerae]|uniref:Cell division protein FtsL n=1 Tax=Sutcliffiella rhizosphaerae TaxID=2880967 RepID=A0ABM8YIV3_9BACI|nr:cell division protein FtsL [Sutcliffiella rhizosphaerae]CAG9619809.1 Cell division protein FtsL [Sutcliffiella rhizosphaerae]